MVLSIRCLTQEDLLQVLNTFILALWITVVLGSVLDVPSAKQSDKLLRARMSYLACAFSSLLHPQVTPPLLPGTSQTRAPDNGGTETKMVAQRSLWNPHRRRTPRMLWQSGKPIGSKRQRRRVTIAPISNIQDIVREYGSSLTFSPTPRTAAMSVPPLSATLIPLTIATWYPNVNKWLSPEENQHPSVLSCISHV